MFTAEGSRGALIPLVVLLVLVGSLGACSDDSPADSASSVAGDDIQEIEAVFADAGLGASDAPGCAVSVVVDDRLGLARGYGTADLVTGEPIAESTAFDIASVSKQFTAASVYLLAERGVLSVEDEIHQYVPELPEYGVYLSLENLVHHTSGLVDYTELLSDDYEDTDVTTTEQALAALVAVPDLTFDPGDEFEYNNSNYFLLGLVVSRVSGSSFAEFLETEVFAPLGMTHTVVRDQAELDVANGAEGYAGESDGSFQIATTNWEQVGDGAVWSTVGDLQTWARNLSTWEVGGAALEAALLTSGEADGSETGYGGGLGLLPGGAVEHSGAWSGFVSDFQVRPADGTAVVVLCNREDVDPTTLAERVLAVIDG